MLCTPELHRSEHSPPFVHLTTLVCFYVYRHRSYFSSLTSSQIYSTQHLYTGGIWWEVALAHDKGLHPHTQVFDNDIAYIEGGTASGFYTVEDTHYVTR